jgi:hypothetical protein
MKNWRGPLIKLTNVHNRPVSPVYVRAFDVREIWARMGSGNSRLLLRSSRENLLDVAEMPEEVAELIAAAEARYIIRSGG